MSTPNPATTYWVPLAAPAAAGGASLTYEGDYVAATSYDDGDVVVKDGIAYICVGGPTTTAPDPVPWGAAALAAPAYGTTLPASPVDGQECILVDNVTNPTFSWRFRYVAAKTSNKWIFVGGAPKIAIVETMEGTNPNNSWVNLPTVGPTLTVPVAGSYLVTASAQLQGGAAVDNVYLGIAMNGSIPDGTWYGLLSSMGSPLVFGNFLVEKTAAAPAGAAFQLLYNSGNQTNWWGNRRLKVTPIAVGG